MAQDYQARAPYNSVWFNANYEAILARIGLDASMLDFSFLERGRPDNGSIAERIIIPIWTSAKNNYYKDKEWFLFLDGIELVAIATLIPAFEYFPH